jgi:ABC-type branched-subunit amino acid transport system substrate-binding protein
MGSKRTVRGAVLACVLGLLAACGDDDDAPSAASAVVGSTEAGGATTDAGADTTVVATTAEPEGDASGFGTARILAGGPYGQDPDNPERYVGAGGFELDLSACPSDWDPVQGITDSEIHLFTSLPRSGPLAGNGLVADGQASYFRFVNETYGGIDGRRIVLDIRDDGYDPSRTKTNVDEMLQAGDTAAITGLLGTPNILGVWDELDQECMPNLFVASGAPQWGDVENHPWTTPLLLDYRSEAQLWAQWLQSEFPDGAKVAAITFNNDFGRSYSQGFRAGIEGTNISLVQEELHDPTAPNLTNQYTSVAASGADVLLIQTSGKFCTQAMAEVERGTWKPTVIMSAVCQSLSQYFQPLIDQGLTGADTHTVQTYRDVNDPAEQDDPAVQLFRDVVSAQGLDPAQTSYATGWLFAWHTAEVLRLASTLEGGLNRANIIVANRSMEARMPLLIDGLSTRMEGMKDAYLIEGGRMVRYTVTDPAQLGSYQPVSDLITNEGKLGTYAAVEQEAGG